MLQIHPMTQPAQIFPDRESWLDARCTFIGASEVASVFGVGYAGTSPITVWASKTGGPVVEFDEATTKRMNRGRKMEPIIADYFTEETGLVCTDPGEFAVYRHQDRNWLAATLDRWAVHDDYGPVPVELKSVNARFFRDWDEDEEPPLKYMVQCQTQIAVTGASHCYLVGLIGGDELVIRLIERNQRFIDAMIARLEEFWGYVLRRELPPVDESEATRSLLSHIWPRDTGLSVYLPPESIEWDRELIDLKDQLKGLEARKNGLENKIKSAIGDASTGLMSNGSSYSWRVQQRKGYMVEPSECRVLRRSAK